MLEKVGEQIDIGFILRDVISLDTEIVRILEVQICGTKLLTIDNSRQSVIRAM